MSAEGRVGDAGRSSKKRRGGGGVATGQIPGGLKKSSALLFGAQLVSNAGFFVAVLILARALPPPGRGTTAFVIVSAMVLARVCSLGVTEAIPVFAARRPSARATLLVTQLLFVTAAATTAALLVSQGLRLLDELPAGLTASDVTVLAVGTIVQAVVDAANAYLAGCGRFAQRARITMTIPWLYALLLAAVSFGVGLDATEAAALWVVSQIVRGALLTAAAARGQSLVGPDLGLIVESVSFGLRTWLGSLSAFLNARIDQLIIGLIANNAVLGFYAVAVNVAETLLYLPDAAAVVLLPSLATDTEETRTRRTLASFRVLALVTVSGIAAAAIVGAPLIPVIFGPSFAPSTVPFLLLLPGALGFVALRVFGSALIASSRPGRSSLGALIALVIEVALDLALIPVLGASGAALAASTAFIAGGAVAATVYRRHSRFAWSALLPGREDVDVLIAALVGLSRAARASLSARDRSHARPTHDHAGTQPVRSRARGLAKAAIVAAQVAGWQARGRPATRGLRILYYHRISAEHDELAVSPGSFRRQLALVAESDQRLIDLYAWAADPASSGDDGIALTFDDGYRDFLVGALPLLMERRWPAVVFVVTDAAAGRIRFPWYPSSHPALLSWDEMREIERHSRVRFEPHTLTHPVLSKVTEDEAWREISGSKAALEDALGREARLFCYPGGHFGRREAALVERAGFRAAVGCEYGVNRPPWVRFALRRTTVDRYDGARIFAARLRGAADVAPIGRRLRGGSPAR